MLKVKEKWSGLSEFLDEGKCVAIFDAGPQDLIFNDGTQYSLYKGDSAEPAASVYPTGSAQIQCIIDWRYEIVADKSSADLTRGFKDLETYYKSAGKEVVAHSETPMNGTNDAIIVCSRRQYKVNCSKKLVVFRAAKLYEANHSVASINSGLFGTRAFFDNYIALSERVFITLLALGLLWNRGNHTVPNE